jgi:hypothetical protein
MSHFLFINVDIYWIIADHFPDNIGQPACGAPLCRIRAERNDYLRSLARKLTSIGSASQLFRILSNITSAKAFVPRSAERA